MYKLLAALILLAPLALADKKQLEPGEWEITVEMEMEGVKLHLPPQTMRKCVTPDQVKQPTDLFRPKSNDNCEMKDVKQEGNKISWKLDCKGRGQGSGTVSFEPGRYDGVATMEMVDKHGTLRKMKSTMRGRRLGECQ